MSVTEQFRALAELVVDQVEAAPYQRDRASTHALQLRPLLEDEEQFQQR